MKQLVSTLLIFAGSVLALNHLSAQNPLPNPQQRIENSLNRLDADLNSMHHSFGHAKSLNNRAAVSTPKKAVAAEIDRINAQLRTIRAMLHATLRKTLGAES
jgi:uncharacterized protein YicC (UPF0701 family)